MKKIMMLAGVMLLFKVGVYGEDAWTLKITGGVKASADGMAFINIVDAIPLDPYPTSAVWKECQYNNIYFHQTASGTAISDIYVDRMLSIAIAAFKTDSYVRVKIERDSSGKCYTSQIFDKGQ